MSSERAADAPAHAVTARRMFPFAREHVFAAWADADALQRWFGGPRTRVVHATADVRVGGRYRLMFDDKRGAVALAGVYQEVEPPARLVFTWSWETPDGAGAGESCVTVDFHDRGGATEVVVTHERLEGDESLAFHRRGWAASLEALAEVL